MPRHKVEEPALTQENLDDLRVGLEAKRKELASFYEHDVRVGKESNDESSDDIADRANNSFNRELMFSLSDGERQRLIQIDAAFRRMDAGAFGECTHCANAIGLARLKAVPWASLCISCQELEEQGLLDEN